MRRHDTCEALTAQCEVLREEMWARTNQGPLAGR